MSFLNFNWGSILLLLFTLFLVFSDRAFSKRVRRDFQLALLFCVFLILVDQHFEYSTGKNASFLGPVLFFESLIRPLVLYLLIMCSVEWKKNIRILFLVPLLLNFVLSGLRLEGLVFLPLCFYAVFLVMVMIMQQNRRECADAVFAAVLVLMLTSSIAAEMLQISDVIINNCLAILTCVYYYYFVMRVYKKDRLTGLLLRHNLTYEMEDNIDKEYDLVLIDVDNFKLINDKYGHDKGDEVLITIVNATLNRLPKGCRMYRYGGDEFVIISRKVSTEDLQESLEKVNEDLAEEDLRISYGIVKHEPRANSEESLTKADKAMYENKRLIKSEDIWDDMTGLYNLRGFLDELDSFRKVVKRDNHMVCLVAVDVERLSSINKAYGYSEGNLIITTLAKSLKSCLRGRDFIGHLGSDEFAVAIECVGKADAYITTFISQLQELVDTSFELSTKEYSVKLNIDRDFIDVTDLASSEEYVNGLLYIKQEEKDNRRKNDISEADKDYSDLDNAVVQDILDNNKLQYAFQPIVSAKDGSILAYESLMRSDTETMISPLKILKYAERNKRSYDVEKLTFFNTLAKFAESKDIPENARIFINSIPGHFLSEVDFDVLKSKYGDLMGRMVVELTEQRELDDDALVVLNTRREKVGFNLAIDDYGSGISNTNNLLRYMPQVVKLDRLLITGIDRNAKKQFFVNSIISFAKENDMMTLAEGVETESELKTVIKLGVDMIQGYVTAKPSVEIVKEIPDEIKKIIVNENLRLGSNPRMSYTVGESCELSVVQLAMEEYSRINISAESITLTGSSEYSADMIIKIKDNTNCHLTLRDVQLNSVDDKPCIELGENTNLTLNIEGTNRINSKGILVPESSSLTLIGPGVLQIFVKGHECYAIGTDTQSAFGNITLKSTGLITLNVDGEYCVGIGGGITGSNSLISFLTGTIDMTVAGVNAVGFGAYKGDVPIRVEDTQMNVVFRVSNGTVFGTMDGIQNIETHNFNFDITGSGTELAVLGSPNKATGHIHMNAGCLKSKFNGHNICFVGGDEGDVDIQITHGNFSLLGEGDNVAGFGTRSEEASLVIKECAVDLTINASSPVAIGAKKKEILYIGPRKEFAINGVSYEIFDF